MPSCNDSVTTAAVKAATVISDGAMSSRGGAKAAARAQGRHGQLINRPGFDGDRKRDENDAQDHRHRTAEAGRDFRGVVVVEIRIKCAQTDTDGGDAESHEANRDEGERHHPIGHVEQEIAQEHEQFSEQEQWYENQPELAPQQRAQRNRRALQNPESLSFQADRRKGKAHGDGAEHETGERKVRERDQGAQSPGGHRRAVQR